MGVYRTDYLMYGVKLAFDQVDYDKHEAEIHGEPGAAFDIVYDGMSGKYAVAGKVIARSDGDEGLEFTEITDDLLPKEPAALKATIEASIGAPVGDMKLYLFSHYS